MKTTQILLSTFALTCFLPSLATIFFSLVLGGRPEAINILLPFSLWPLLCVWADLSVGAASVTLWLFLELLFYVYYRRRLQEWQALTEPPPYHEPPVDLHRKVLTTLKSQKITAWDYFSLWFHGRTLHHDIHSGNIRKFYAWAYFARGPQHLEKEETRDLDEILEMTQRDLKVQFVEGEHPEAVPIRLTLDPLLSAYRPLLLYVGTSILHEITGLVLRWWGFSYHKGKQLSYWFREAEKPTQPPAIFFHGIGIGLFPYLYFVSNLAKGRTSILVEIPFIDSSMMWSQRIPEAHQIVDAVAAILKHHNLPKVVVVGHSFGTVIVGWIAKSLPQVVAQTVFLDPVCFLLFLPQVAYNFQYRNPTTFLEHVFYYFASREIHIARTLKRHFWWYQNVVFADDLDQYKTTVVLGGRDEVAPTAAVRTYLLTGEARGCACLSEQQDKKLWDEAPLKDEAPSKPCSKHSASNPALTVLWYPTFSHTQMLFSKDAVRDVMTSISRNH